MLLAVALALAAEPTFSVERGVYEAPFSLTVSAPSPGDTVLVSTDGSLPSSPPAGAIDISGTALVRAQVIGADGTVGEVVTHTYIFPADVVEQPTMDAGITGSGQYAETLLKTLAELPSVSIVTPSALSTTEQAVSAEYIHPDGDDLGVNCGAALSGTTSLGYPKNSIRLYFRSEYGTPKVEFDFWPLDHPGVAPSRDQDALSLRSGHDSVFYLGAQGQYVRNAWMDASQLEMGHLAPHVGFAHLYVNGSYTGLYHVRERFGAAFMANYLGGDEDEYEAVNEGNVISGSGAGWAALLARAADLDGIDSYLHVDHFIDYMLLNFYAGNAWDWYYWHNWMAAGPSEADAGGFRFYSSDSDICLYYDWTVDITDNPGPSQLFATLLAEGHPDFMVALADGIHRNFEGDGPLTPGPAADRYLWLASMVEDAVVAESARWGGGWWDRDDEWSTERDRLVDQFFPYRTEELLRQVESQGWYPVPAPSLSAPAGNVAAGTALTVTAPFGQAIVYTTDGRDPREPGGAVAATATRSDDTVGLRLDRTTVVSARLLEGSTWGPLERATYTVSEPAVLVLNEYNPVQPGELLDERDFEGSGADDALGRVDGNGGAWIELVVVGDVDLAGWRLELDDLRGPAGTITFTAEVPPLRAGTILTVSADLPEDASVDPDGGDWRLQLTATPDGTYTRSDGFRASAHDWQLRAYDAEGYLRLGPVGEGIAPRRGVGAHEVGALLGNPSNTLSPSSGDYGASTRSTYAAANQWEGGEQDLAALRGGGSGIVELDDTGALAPVTIDGGGCGCATATPGPGWATALLALLVPLLARRARFAPAIVLVACGAAVQPAGESALDSSPAGGTPEVCNGVDDDGDGQVDNDPVDALPFYADTDGDGYGDESRVVHACAAGDGHATLGGDCDDADPSRHPGAEEGCGTVDYDCDGTSSTESGTDADCPATSCLAVYEALGSASDGPRWLELPSGTVAEVYCDMAGGGWTLAFVRNSASTASQGSFGSGEENVAAVASSPESASASDEATMGWLDVEALDWTELRLTAASQGSRTYTSRSVPREELRVKFGEPGYLLYGGTTGYYWCGGPASYTDAGVGAVNNPDGAPLDCKGHGSLGSGWDFSESSGANAGLTLCGGDASAWLYAAWASQLTYYGTAGGAQAIWVR